MTFADYCLFAIANTVLHEGRGVTLSFATEFIDAVYKGDGWSRAPVKSSAPGARSFLCAACSPRKARPVLSFWGR